MGDRLAAHIIIAQLLPQSETGAWSGQQGMPSDIEIPALSASPLIMAWWFMPADCSAAIATADRATGANTMPSTAKMHKNRQVVGMKGMI